MSSEEKALEEAYNTVSGWLMESGCLTSEMIPKLKDPDTLTALQPKAAVEEYEAENRF